MNEPLYNSKRWRKHAAAVLSHFNYTDQVQIRYGRMETADVVHHALPIEDYPEYTWSTWNHIPVSRRTHRLLHNDDGSLTRMGIDLAQRTARKAGVEFTAQKSRGNRWTAGRNYSIKKTI